MAPECYPFLNGTHYGAPQVAIGTHGKHLFWACTHNAVTHQPRIHSISCRHGACSDEVLKRSMSYIAQSGLTGLATRITSAKTMYRQHVTIDCEAMRKVDEPTAEQKPGWDLCFERDNYLVAFGRGWFPTFPWSTP
jgi:hypothetical protein